MTTASNPLTTNNQRPCTSSAIEQIVGAAARGDRSAREQLVRRYERVVWATVRRFHLGEADVQDAVQNTWLRLFEHIGAVRNPDRLAGWLATTARRECIRFLRRARHEVVGLETEMARVDDTGPDPERLVLDHAMNALLWREMAKLPLASRDLLVKLVASEAMPYKEFASFAHIPVGSIGPTRMRCLRTLRRQLEDAGLDAPAWR